MFKRINVEFSKHALEQMMCRNISIVVANNILRNPQQIVNQGDKTIYQSVVTENRKQYLIRIFVNTKKDPNIVVTAYKTSKIDKYYEG